MKKNQKMLIPVVVVLLTSMFASCKLMDSIAYNVKKVKPSDLGPVSGNYVDSKDTAIQAIMFGGTGAIEAGMTATESLDGSAVRNLMNVISLTSPTLYTQMSSDSSRSFTLNENITDGEFPFNVDMEILDETKDVEDGNVTFENVIFEASAESDVKDISTAFPTWISVEFDGEANVSLTKIPSMLPDGTSLIVENAKLNLMAKGNGELKIKTIEGMPFPDSLDYYAAMDLSVGLAISADGYSGKYIINFKFVNSGIIDNFEDPDDMTGDMELILSVDVYNNDNDLINTYDYDQEYFTNLFESL